MATKQQDLEKKVKAALAAAKKCEDIFAKNPSEENLKKWENAVSAAERAQKEKNGPNSDTGGGATGDPHFIGLDSKRYDVMPSDDAVYFSTKDGACLVTAGHEKSGKGSNAPSWIIRILIKLDENYIYFDRENCLLLNRLPTKLSMLRNGQEIVGYCYLKDSYLVVWHRVFGKYYVENCCNYNLNLAVTIPSKVVESASGLLCGVEPKMSWKPPPPKALTEEEEKAKIKIQQKFPHASAQDIADMLLDFGSVPPEQREQVFNANLSSIANPVLVAIHAKDPESKFIERAQEDRESDRKAEEEREKERKAQEERERERKAEEERKRKAEEEREKERKAQEERERKAEEERKRKAEEEREKERKAQEERERERKAEEDRARQELFARAASLRDRMRALQKK